MAWQNPKTDWAVNPKNPVPEDFNRIEGNIDFLKGDIETKKGAIVNALNTVGLASELTDTHATLANRITGANQGTKIYTPGTANITIPKGFHSGQGYVKGDANLVPENIVKGKRIFDTDGNYEWTFTPGEIVQAESNAEVHISSTTYTKYKEIQTNLPGAVRVYFEIRCNAGVYVRIYKNDAPIGIERYHEGTWVGFHEDIAVSVGDLIQIYAKKAGFDSAYARNFKIKSGESPIYFIINM